MGRGIVRAVLEQKDMELTLATDMNNLGIDVGEHLGLKRIGVPITSPDSLGDSLDLSGTELLVDFTNREAALENAKVAGERGLKLVIGTTGLKKLDQEKLKDIVEKNSLSAVVSPNMASGVNIFFKLGRDAAACLGDDYDVEIVEAHHRHKKDAPSGTALKLGELIAGALKRDVEKDGVYGRRGLVGERGKREIGFHAVRAGEIVGEHTVMFAGQGERIEITHRAQSRDAFVNGVLKAIRFLARRPADGRVYSTWDVLHLK
jgi:4-hydroxy-tetrahydrodipicolinate reductase